MNLIENGELLFILTVLRVLLSYGLIKSRTFAAEL